MANRKQRRQAVKAGAVAKRDADAHGRDNRAAAAKQRLAVALKDLVVAEGAHESQAKVEFPVTLDDGTEVAVAFQLMVTPQTVRQSGLVIARH